jgi:hypothetical protein
MLLPRAALQRAAREFLRPPAQALSGQVLRGAVARSWFLQKTMIWRPRLLWPTSPPHHPRRFPKLTTRHGLTRGRPRHARSQAAGNSRHHSKARALGAPPLPYCSLPYCSPYHSPYCTLSLSLPPPPTSNLGRVAAVHDALRRACPPPPPPVLSGHAASLTPY